MAKIGIVGETYQETSLPFNAQRSINLYPVMDQTGKEVAAMYGTPGLLLFGNMGTGAIRADFSCANGRAFAVSGSTLYEVASDGTGTSRGSLNQSSGIVYMAENGLQLAICDGTSLYIFTYATNIFKQIIGGLNYATNGTFTTDTAWTKGTGWTISGGVAVATGAISVAIDQTSTLTLVAGVSYVVQYTMTVSAGSLTASIGGTAGITRTGAGTYVETIVCGATQDIAFTGAGFTGTLDNVTISDPAVGLPASVGCVWFIDSYFMVSQNGTRHFNISSPNDGTKWAALDFASKESSPDSLKKGTQAVGQVWLQGDKTSEIWSNTGAASFPFARITGAKIEVGIYAPATAIAVDNSMLWVGSSKEGNGIVYRAQGFFPLRISTTPIEVMIRAATDPTNIRAYTYQRDGHLFYVLTGGGLATSLVYDITTKMWHERAWLNSQGQFETHLGTCCMSAFGSIIVGDKNNGNLYLLDENTYTDNGGILAAERVYTTLSDEDKRMRYNRLVIGVENGVGLQSGQGSAPTIELQLSKDGARTWSDIFTSGIGAVGKYMTKVVFRRLGIAEQITFKIRITDPVKRVIVGSYLT